MSGFFTRVLAGMIGGAGAGMANVGQQMGQAAIADQNNQALLDRQLALQEARSTDQQELAQLRADLKGGGASRSRTAGGGVGGSLSLDAIDSDPLVQMAFAGGGTKEDYQIRLRRARGEDLTHDQSLPGPPDESGNAPVKKAEYSEGRVKEALQNSTMGMFAAFGIQAAKGSEDMAKGATEMQRYGLTEKAAGGDTGAAGTLLVSQGKDLMSGDGTNVLTGQAAPGSVAASKIKAEGALAAERMAAAGKNKAETDRTRTGVDPAMPALRELRSSATSELEAARKTLRDYDMTMKDLPMDEREARATDRADLVKAVKDKEALLSDVTTSIQSALKRLTPEGKGDSKGGEKPSQAQAMAEAKAAIAKRPDRREAILQRMKALGYSTQGL